MCELWWFNVLCHEVKKCLWFRRRCFRFPNKQFFNCPKKAEHLLRLCFAFDVLVSVWKKKQNKIDKIVWVWFTQISHNIIVVICFSIRSFIRAYLLEHKIMLKSLRPATFPLLAPHDIQCRINNVISCSSSSYFYISFHSSFKHTKTKGHGKKMNSSIE